MRTNTLLVFGAAMMLIAAEPIATPPASAGKVAVLDNHQLIEGDIERRGQQYRVKRTVGETWVPAQRVVHVGPDRLDALAYLQRHTNLRDADERVKLARWCLAHSLRPQALAEAKAALALRPEDPEIAQIVRSMEQLAANPPVEAPPRPEIVQVSGVVEETPTPPDFNADAMTLFVTRVQPILMNTCASCHAAEDTKAFRLVRVFEGSQNRRATQQNLAATLVHIHRDEPASSPLLTKALLPHGGSITPPVRDRSTAVYRTLEAWSKFAVSRPGARYEEFLSPAPTVVPPTTPPPMVDPMSPMAAFPLTPTSPVNSGFGELRSPPASVPRLTPPTAEKKFPGEVDPFDPEGFNEPGKK